MEAIILAGGRGLRLKSVVSDVPKAMALVGEKPFLEILLSMLARKGFSLVVLSLGYMADKIISYFGDHFAGMELVYEIERTPLGTGGAVRNGMSRCNLDHVFVFNGDTYLDLEVTDMENDWQRHNTPIIVAREVSNVSRYGCLETKNDRVGSFSEKKLTGPGLINAGCYLLPIHILDQFPIGEPFSLETDFLAKAVKTQHFNLFLTKGYFIDIGIPVDYARAQSELPTLFR